MKKTKSTRITKEICNGISTQESLRYVKHIELNYKLIKRRIGLQNKKGQSHKM